MVTEDYVSFEIAKLLKEKGFDEACRAVYEEGVLRINTLCDYHNSELSSYVCAPTLQMAVKWLRENHGLHLEIHRFNNSWFYMIIDMVDDKTLFSDDCGTYDECIDNGLKYCLENLV